MIGSLMRLNKQDFHELLNEPLLHWVELEHARGLVARGARWLDDDKLGMMAEDWSQSPEVIADKIIDCAVEFARLDTKEGEAPGRVV